MILERLCYFSSYLVSIITVLICLTCPAHVTSSSRRFPLVLHELRIPQNGWPISSLNNEAPSWIVFTDSCLFHNSWNIPFFWSANLAPKFGLLPWNHWGQISPCAWLGWPAWLFSSLSVLSDQQIWSESLEDKIWVTFQKNFLLVCLHHPVGAGSTGKPTHQVFAVSPS